MLVVCVSEVLVVVNSEQQLSEVRGRMVALDTGQHSKQQR